MSVNYYGSGKAVSLENKLAFQKSTAELEATTTGNMSVVDRDGTEIIRKENDILFIEDFKENNPTTAVTVTGSWTLADAIGSINGYQAARLTQVAGSLGATAEILSVALNEKALGVLMGLIADFKYTGNANEIQVDVLQSDDNVSYDVLESMTLTKSDDVSVLKLLHKFRSTATHTGIRLTVISLNVGAVLEFKNIRWEYDPAPTAEFIQTNTISLENNDGRVVSQSTEDIHWSGSGNGWVSSGTDNYYEVQNNNTVVSIDGNAEFTTNGRRTLGLYKNGVLYRYYIAHDVGNGSTTSITKFQFQSSRGEFVKGDRLSIRITAGGTSTLRVVSNKHYININEEVKSTNVLFKGQSGGNTVTTVPSGNLVAINGVQSALTQSVVKDQWYEMDFAFRVNTRVSSNNMSIDILENGNRVVYLQESTNGTEDQLQFTASKKFKATADGQVTVVLAGSNQSSQFVYDISTYLQLTPTDSINSIPVTDEVENVYSARLTTVGVVVSQSSPFIESIVSDVANEFLITWKAGFFTEAPVIVSMAENSSDVDVQYNWSNLTSTSVRVHGVFGTTSTGVRNFTIVVQRQGADYKAPQGHFIGNMPLSSGQLDGTEYWTGKKLGGRRVMARTWEIASTIDGDTVIATIDTGLDVINAVNYLSDIFTLHRTTTPLSGAEDAHIYYRKLTGEVRAIGDGSYSVIAGTIFTIEYLE